MKIDLARLEAMPSIVAEMVKPAEKIDSIKIHQVSGIGAAGGNGSNGQTMSAGAAEKPVVNQALDSIMGMAVQMPALKKLGEELGLSMEDGVSGIASAALGAAATNAAEQVAPVVDSAATEVEPGASA